MKVRKGSAGHCSTAVELYRLMVPAEKQIAKEWHDVFAKDFRVNQFLKELKSKKNKEKTAPAPHRKEKNKKEKVQKTCVSVGHAQPSLEERKKAFWGELEKFIGKYKRQMVLRFFYYWAEEMKGLDMMKWELEESWNTSFRLAAWSKKSYNKDDEAADLRLERAKGKKASAGRVLGGSSAEEQAIAAEREAADAQREEATAKAKAESITMEDYLKKNPNSILRTLKKND